ncbi:MAG: insulinase family protein [Wolbachia endosymbiont of Fragariocoptes setiger]|nr:insulinase family protein [Wolbachia endosymbiont of Fragariocoptes setiger]
MRISSLMLLLFYLCLNLPLSIYGKINVEEVVTRRGFKFLFTEDHYLPKVIVYITFKKAGYLYEDQQKQGLSYLTSLVINNGSGENDEKQFARIMANKGISLDFSSEEENFTVLLNTLSENLEDGISLMSDALIRPRIDEKGMSRALEETKFMFAYLEKDPNHTGKTEIIKLMFKDHPYSNSPLGNMEAVMSIDRNDIFNYIKNSFTKSNIVISVVGSVKKERVAKLLDKYLFELPSQRSTDIVNIPVNNITSAVSKHIFMNIPQSTIFFGQKGVSRDDNNYYNAQVLMEAMGGSSLNSVLLRELRQNLGITYSVSAHNISNTYGSVILGNLSTDHSTVDQAILAVKDVFYRIKKEGIEEKLLNKAKISTINDYTFSMFDYINIAAYLNYMQIYDYNINYINDFPKYINDVKIEQVNDLAYSLLDNKNLFFVNVGKGTSFEKKEDLYN